MFPRDTRQRRLPHSRSRYRKTLSALAASAVVATTPRGSSPSTSDVDGGRSGAVVPGPAVTVASVTRGGVEVRLVRIDGPTTARALRIGGWPLSSAEEPRTTSDAAGGRVFAEAASSDLYSAISGLHGLSQAGVTTEQDTSPLGGHTAVPWLATQSVVPGAIAAAYVVLARRSIQEPAPVVTIQPLTDGGHRIVIDWRQGASTTVTLPSIARLGTSIGSRPEEGIN